MNLTQALTGARPLNVTYSQTTFWRICHGHYLLSNRETLNYRTTGFLGIVFDGIRTAWGLWIPTKTSSLMTQEEFFNVYHELKDRCPASSFVLHFRWSTSGEVQRGLNGCRRLILTLYFISCSRKWKIIKFRKKNSTNYRVSIKNRRKVSGEKSFRLGSRV